MRIVIIGLTLTVALMGCNGASDSDSKSQEHATNTNDLQDNPNATVISGGYGPRPFIDVMNPSGGSGPWSISGENMIAGSMTEYLDFIFDTVEISYTGYSWHSGDYGCWYSIWYKSNETEPRSPVPLRLSITVKGDTSNWEKNPTMELPCENFKLECQIIDPDDKKRLVTVELPKIIEGRVSFSSIGGGQDKAEATGSFSIVFENELTLEGTFHGTPSTSCIIE